MADPRIIPAEELARYEANVLRVNGWAYYMDAESERVIKRLIEHGKAQAEQVATLTRDLAHREKYDPQWADAFRSIEARADAAETQADKAWKILGDLGFCVRCKDGSTMPCVECGAGL